MVFWGGRKYAIKARAEREEVVKKALDLVADPKKYNRAIAYGAAKYVKQLKFDNKTGGRFLKESNFHTLILIGWLKRRSMTVIMPLSPVNSRCLIRRSLTLTAGYGKLRNHLGSLRGDFGSAPSVCV